jgi:hypothetical protein
MHLPAPREAPNGNGPGGRIVVGEGKALGVQKQQQQGLLQQEQHHIDVFNMEGNLSFLEQSIADLDRMSASHVISTSSSSILGNLPLPNLFSMQHVKQEVDFGLEKDLARIAVFIRALGCAQSAGLVGGRHCAWLPTATSPTVGWAFY